MKQMNISDDQKINFDFSRFRLPHFVGEFQPLLFKDNDFYFAVLGPDPQRGISGCGNTPEDALIDWNNNLRENLRHPDPNDPVMQYVIDTINSKKKDVW